MKALEMMQKERNLKLLSKRILIRENNQEVIGLMKDELRSEIIKKALNLRPQIYSYIKSNDEGHIKSKDRKMYYQIQTKYFKIF